MGRGRSRFPHDPTTRRKFPTMSTTTATSVRWAWERAVRDDENLSRAAKLLGLTLATYMAPNGKCRPSKARLTHGLRYTSHESLDDPRSELRKAGYLSTARHLDRPTEYRATMPNRLDCRSEGTQTETANIANVLSQPAGLPVSQPAGLPGRTDHRTTDHLKDLRGIKSALDEGLASPKSPATDAEPDRTLAPQPPVNAALENALPSKPHEGGAAEQTPDFQPYRAKIVRDSDEYGRPELVDIYSEAHEIRLAEGGCSVYRVKALDLA